jgi:hypothetical protein
MERPGFLKLKCTFQIATDKGGITTLKPVKI